jgi:hypothetical protein
MSSEDIALESLVGAHELSGVSFDDIPAKTELNPEYEDANRCTFILDGEAYQAIEDPSDGYRSTLRTLLRCDPALVSNRFEPIQVVGSMRGRTGYTENDVIDFRDTRNGKVILSVGTENTDDYYPSYVADWQPENIFTSAGRGDTNPTSIARHEP